MNYNYDYEKKLQEQENYKLKLKLKKHTNNILNEILENEFQKYKNKKKEVTQ